MKSKRKGSACKGLRTSTCRHRPSCKMAMGRKRSFCRTKKNKSKKKRKTTSRDVFYSA